MTRRNFGVFQLSAGRIRPTHWQGNTLDLVIKRSDCQQTACTVDPPKVISATPWSTVNFHPCCLTGARYTVLFVHGKGLIMRRFVSRYRHQPYVLMWMNCHPEWQTSSSTTMRAHSGSSLTTMLRPPLDCTEHVVLSSGLTRTAGTCPVYFKDVWVPLASIPGCTNLWAADRGDLLVPSTKTKNGGRSFRVAAPTVWNSLPFHFHTATISERQFKSALKTHVWMIFVLWELLKSKLTYSWVRIRALLFSHHSVSAFNKLRSLTKCSLDVQLLYFTQLAILQGWRIE